MIQTTAEPAEDELAVRGGVRYVPRLVADPLGRSGAHREPRVRPDGAYLITGAFGGRGLPLAHWLARSGAGRIIMLDDTSVPDRSGWYDEELPAEDRFRAREVRDLERLGVEVDVVACDVTDPVELAEAFEAAQAGPLPLRGVLHAATVRVPRPIAAATAEEYRRVVRPGMIGGWLLHELSAAANLDFFVCFATATGNWGAPGQAGRAAADAFLDSLAHYRTARALPALTVAWGPWRGTRDLADETTAEELRATGVHPLAPPQCIRLLAALIASRRTAGAVCAVDWPRCLPAGPDGPRRPVLRELQPEPRPRSAASARAPESSTKRLLEGAQP